MTNYFLDNLASKTVFGIIPACSQEPADNNVGSPYVFKGGQYPTGGITVARTNMATGYGFNKTLQAEKLDGVDDQFSISSDIGDLSANKFSFSCWLNLTDTSISRILFSKRVSASVRIEIYLINTGLLYVAVCNGDSGTLAEISYTPYIGNKVHIVIVCDLNGASNEEKLQFYANGIAKNLIFSGTLPSTLPNVSSVPAYLSKAPNAIFGFLYQFLFCNNNCSSTEIANLYQLGPDLGGLILNADGTLEIFDNLIFNTIEDTSEVVKTLSTLVFNNFKMNYILGQYDLENDSFKIALMKPTLSNLANLEDYTSYSEISTYEVSGTGYTTGGQELSNLSITKDNVKNRVVWNGDDVVWENTSVTAIGAIIYHVATGDLVLFQNYKSSKTTDLGKFTHNFNSNGILVIN